MIEQADPSRENGLSSLDFAVWVHEGVETSYDRTVPFAFPEADYDAIEQEYDLIRDALRLCGVNLKELADDHSNLVDLMSSNKFLSVPVPKAVRTRGALLFNGSRLAVSMGFGYIVHYEDDRYVYRYLSNDEVDKWTNGYLIRELSYQ